MTPEETVIAYFDAYSAGRPDRFDQIVAADYLDYGHTPPGRGPQGARDDYEHAVQVAGGVIRYDTHALVASEHTVEDRVLVRLNVAAGPEVNLPDVPVRGFVFDENTGRLSEVFPDAHGDAWLAEHRRPGWDWQRCCAHRD